MDATWHSAGMRTALMIVPLLWAASANAAENPTARGMNEFAAAAWQKLAPPSGNLIFSPFSISTALSMALVGARGKTAEEISSLLRAAPDAQFVEELAKSGNSGGDEFLHANGL